MSSPQPEGTPLLAGARHDLDDGLSFNASVWVALGGVWALAAVAFSGAPFGMLFVLASALLPAWYCFFKIRKELADDAVSLSFLVITFFVMLFPGSWVIGFSQFLTSSLGVVMVFGKSLKPLLENVWSDGKDIADTMQSFGDMDNLTDEQQRKLFRMFFHLWKHLRDDIPLWRLVMVALVLAFLSLALAEQVGTLVVARRYRDLPRQVGVRGVVSVACMSALGLATAQHKGAVCGMYDGSVLGSIVFGLVRAALEFPLHLLTGLFIGVQLARYAVLSEDVAAWELLGVPVLAQGTSTFFVMMAFFEWDNAPVLIPLAVIVVIAVLVFLWRYVMRAYNETLNKEDIVPGAQA